MSAVFNGKRRALTDLACRQRKAGQWVDNTGIMVLTTAHYLGRNIHLYSYPSGPGSSEFSLTKIEVEEVDQSLEPLTIFFWEKHYQTLQHHTPGDHDNDDNYDTDDDGSSTNKLDS